MLTSSEPGLLRIIINKAVVLVGAITLLAGPTMAATHEYHVTLSDDLQQLDVKARLDAGVRSIRARLHDARKYLFDARDCARDEPLATGSRLSSPSGDLTCVAYSVDLRKAAKDNPRLQSFGRDTLVLPVDDWMWRPRLGSDDEVRVTFNVSAGIEVSMPWQPIDAARLSFRLVSTPRSGTGLSIFGKFDSAVVRVADANLRIVALPSPRDPANPDLIDWTRQTATNITLTYGRFPNPDARVVLFPIASGWSGSAVPFGRVVRDGGETIELLVNPDQPEESFLGHWTTTHEFTHLMLPYLGRRDRWVSEGFAQYYQNVLLARAGRYSPARAWREIREGLERGRQSVPHLSPGEAASAAERNSRMKIYWSGAALALIADIELRRRSNGRASLDLVLDRFQSCCLPSRRTWTARELFAVFDEFIDTPLFVELYDRHAHAAGFPDFDDYLGAEELAEIRATITARRYTDEPGN